MSDGQFISNAPRPGQPKDYVSNFILKRSVNVRTLSGKPEDREPEILKEIKSMSPYALAERMQSDPVFAERCRRYRP